MLIRFHATDIYSHISDITTQSSSEGKSINGNIEIREHYIHYVYILYIYIYIYIF